LRGVQTQKRICHMDIGMGGELLSAHDDTPRSLGVSCAALWGSTPVPRQSRPPRHGEARASGLRPSDGMGFAAGPTTARLS
jgi:hypothetical protein